MIKYKKKPISVEAIQFTGKNGWQINKWSNGLAYSSPVLEPNKNNPTGEYMQINTLEGTMIANVGDYIIKGIKNEFYPCKSDIFEATYEKAEG